MDTKIDHTFSVMREIKWHLCLILMITPIAFKCYGNHKINDTDSLRTGQPIPRIVFDSIVNSTQIKFSTKELHGKPAILYFFSTGCKASFAHFSKISELYNAHKKDFTLIMVGIDLEDNIQGVYQKYSRKYNINLPTAFDKVEYKKYNIRGVPRVIWIRKDGVVQAITNILDEGYLEKFVAGREFDFINRGAGAREPIDYNPEEPFLINGNGGESEDFIQRSLLAEWKIGMAHYVPFAKPNESPFQGLKFLQVIGRDLGDLYRLAYFGRTYWYPEDSVFGHVRYSPILEIEDKSKFESNFSLGKNLFCYSQVLPFERRNPDQMMEVMQRDLKNFFGYDVEVEMRQMPYLSLVVSDTAKMKSLTSNRRLGESSSSLIDINYIDKPIFNLVALLNFRLNLVLIDLPLIDETGIRNNVDVSFKAIMTDLSEVKAALQKLGLDVVKKKRLMKVIVIRESKLSSLLPIRD